MMPQTNHRQQSQQGRQCALCESRRGADTVEIFQYVDEFDIYIFRIDTAQQIAADGRTAASIPVEMLRRMLGMSEYDIAHLAHVDPAKPGIFTRRFGAPILLDGIHRAIRCFVEKRPFSAYELSYEESLECLVQQRVSTKDIDTIVRKLRRALKFFPGTSTLDTPIECRPDVLREIEKKLAPAERRRLLLRAVPEPQ